MARRGDSGVVRPDQPVAIVPGQSWMHQSQQWPLFEALVNTDWPNDEALVSVIVARESPRSRKVGAATFLIDLGCLGIKNSIVRLFPTARDYATGLRRDMFTRQEFHAIDFDLAAKIVLTGEAYARSLGLSHPADAAQAKLLLPVPILLRAASLSALAARTASRTSFPDPTTTPSGLSLT